MTKMRLSSFSRPASEIAPSDSGSSISPSPQKHQTLRPLGVGESAALQIAQEAGLIDRHQRPEAHRNRRELPEVGHQPGMRIGREPFAADLLPEIDELVLGQPPLEKRASVNAGRAVALEIDEVAAVLFVGGAPEMHEAGIVKRRRRLEARDMAAEFGGFFVGAQHDRGRVPADIATDRRFQLAIAGMRGLVVRVDRVDVGRVGGERQLRALAARRGDDGVEQRVDAFQSLERLDRSPARRATPALPRVGLVASSDMVSSPSFRGPTNLAPRNRSKVFLTRRASLAMAARG